MNTTLSRPPTLARIFLTWFLLGIQSFGGGSSTFLLIRQVVVARGWLTEEAFVRAWALAQISPGINLLKLTALVTHQLRGWPGVAAGFVGMLLPSGIVTVLMTAGFEQIRNVAWVQAATRGVLPATIGLSLAMAAQMAAPILKQSRKDGALVLALHLGVIALAAGLMYAGVVSPAALLVGAGALVAVMQRLTHKGHEGNEEHKGKNEDEKEGKPVDENLE